MGKKNGDVWAQIGLYTSLGFILPAAAFVGCACGWYLDRRFGTRLLFTVLLGFMGAAAGFIEILQILRRAEKNGDGGSNSGTGSG